ncbi:unnamed protein product [Rhodiola kirilowii]
MNPGKGHYISDWVVFSSLGLNFEYDDDVFDNQHKLISDLDGLKFGKTKSGNFAGGKPSIRYSSVEL